MRTTYLASLALAILVGGLGGGCTLHAGQLAYTRMTDGRVGYSEALLGELDADDGKKLEMFAVKYRFAPEWRKYVTEKAVHVNTLYRAAEFTKERGVRYFLLGRTPAGVLSATTPYEPQKLDDDNTPYALYSDTLVVIPIAARDEATPLLPKLPHRVVYDADQVLATLAPFVLGKAATKRD